MSQVPPGDEDGDSGEDQISALHGGHNRAGAARFCILSGMVGNAGGLVFFGQPTFKLRPLTYPAYSVFTCIRLGTLATAQLYFGLDKPEVKVTC